jgi:hypothetical protein
MDRVTWATRPLPSPVIVAALFFGRARRDPEIPPLRARKRAGLDPRPSFVSAARGSHRRRRCKPSLDARTILVVTPGAAALSLFTCERTQDRRAPACAMRGRARRLGYSRGLMLPWELSVQAALDRTDQGRGLLMQTNTGVVTIDEGAGAKSRPILSRFWLKGGRYRVTIPEEGWGHATLDQCQIGEASKPAHIENPGPAGTIFFRLDQGFYRFVLTEPIEMQPKSAEIMRLEG